MFSKTFVEDSFSGVAPPHPPTITPLYPPLFGHNAEFMQREKPSQEFPIQLIFKRRSNDLENSKDAEFAKQEEFSDSADRSKGNLFTFERLQDDDNTFSISLKKCQSISISPEDDSSFSSNEFQPLLQTELKIFRSLFFLCFKLFSGEKIVQEDLSLNPSEVLIFNCILKRKFVKRSKVAEFDIKSKPKLERIEQIILKKNLKRPEECYKFIHTRVLKYLKRRFRSNFNIKKDLNSNFYRYYFQGLAERLQIPISKFNYPLYVRQTKGGKPIERMALNADYFKLVFKSRRFKHEFDYFTSDILLFDCRQDIIQKLERMMLKWENQIKKSSVDSALFEIEEYLLKNKHCKLPWTLLEIRNSVQKLSLFGNEE